MSIEMKTEGWTPAFSQRIPASLEQAHEEALTTTYSSAFDPGEQVQAPYPPGYAGYYPGVRDKFGYRRPAPDPPARAIHSGTIGPPAKYAPTPLPPSIIATCALKECEQKRGKSLSEPINRLKLIEDDHKVLEGGNSIRQTSYVEHYGDPGRFTMCISARGIAQASGAGLGYCPNSPVIQGLHR